MLNLGSDSVISTCNLSKIYKLYKSPKDRLRESLHIQRKKFHKEFYALRNINLEIKRGEVIGIVGKNGSGKSTLLKILSRVLTPTSGEFMVKGKVSSLLELGSGFNPELTGLENVYFYGTILGFSEEKINGKLQEILGFADIGDFIYQPLKTYSSGMRARLAFSVAINVEPDILILDEVLAVGDALFKRKCYARMEGFFKGRKTVLLVSHSVSDINELCTRAIMLDQGEFIIEGPTKLITSQYERFIFSNREKQHKIKQELIRMNEDLELKEKVYNELNIYHKNTTANLNKVDENNASSNMLNSDTLNKPKNIQHYFLDTLLPKSTVHYKNGDVDIYDIEILSNDGVKVNVLQSAHEYIYKYKVKFNSSYTNVHFGMMIKTEKGTKLIGGNSFNNDLLIPIVYQNELYQVTWHFQCNLLKGDYYMNASVVSLVNGEHKFLNRIVDAIMFRVNKEEKSLGKGIVQMNQRVAFKKI